MLRIAHILFGNNSSLFYEDSALAQANAILIGVSLIQLRTSQFNTRMEFLAKFLGEINCFNEFSDEKMSSSTCVSYLNIEISEDGVLNSEARWKMEDGETGAEPLWNGYICEKSSIFLGRLPTKK